MLFRSQYWQLFHLSCPCIKLVLLLLGVLRDVEREIVLGHILGPFWGFHYASSAIGLLGLGLGPLM